MDLPDEELAAPCRWCAYNGPNYWQAASHDKDCPWHTIGGSAAREAILSGFRSVGSCLAVKTAIDRLSWYEAPTPTRYQIRPDLKRRKTA